MNPVFTSEAFFISLVLLCYRASVVYLFLKFSDISFRGSIVYLSLSADLSTVTQQKNNDVVFQKYLKRKN